MRKRTSLIFVGFLFLFCTCVTDDGDSYKKHFIHYFGADGDHYAADMVVNSDGSIVILGTAEFPANSGIRRIYLAKTDKDGNTLWERVLGEFTENAKDIEPITNGTYAGGYLILSNLTTDAVSGRTAIKVIRVDANGDKVGIDSLKHDSMYQPSNFGSSITALSDGGFIVTGNSSDITLTDADNDLNGDDIDDPEELTDLLSLRYDENFLLTPGWEESDGGERDGMGVKIFEISATQFYSAGYSNATPNEPATPANTEFNFYYVELNEVGISADASYSGSAIDQERMNAVCQTVFGDYFAVGSVTQSGGIQRAYISRIASNFSGATGGDVRTDFLGEAVAVAPAGQTQVLVASNIITPGGTRDIWITKITRDFVEEAGFPVTFGAAGNDDTASAIAEMPNGDILILGTMNLINQNKIALIKIKANGGF